jgi:c(7)-type cytochrome triheme protein
LLLFGCNAGKNVEGKSTSAAKTAKHVDSRAEVKARAAKAPCDSKLFDQMDASTYHGDPEKYGDVIMDQLSSKNGMDPVVFSHKTHRGLYTCRVCHLELDFSMKKGESGITREDYLDGRYCGACHDGKLAFHVDKDCNLCHIPVDNKGRYKTKKVTVKGVSEQDYGDGVNWVESMRSGAISPKTSMVNEENPSTMPLPGHLQNERLRWTTKSPSYPVSVPVWFPHEVHVQWLDCANCHPDIFMVKKNGTVDFDKGKILEGQYCGTCHLSVAFPMDGCRRCHPHRKKKKKQLQ